MESAATSARSVEEAALVSSKQDPCSENNRTLQLPGVPPCQVPATTPVPDSWLSGAVFVCGCVAKRRKGMMNILA